MSFRYGLYAAIAACLLLAACQQEKAPENTDGAKTPVSENPARPLDFYVLSLSWSPGYCLIAGDKADRQQCARGAGHGFIVHGLWPQFEKGYPEFCRSDLPEFVPPGLTQSMFDLMPSANLIRHQWKKHGTCSGLDQRAYFDLLRAAQKKIVVPRQFQNYRQERRINPKAVEAAFAGANKGMPLNGIAVTCGRRHLREVRICMTQDLRFRSCEEVDGNACRLNAALLPAPR